MLKNALRLAAYQIYFSPHVPEQAVVNTSVNLVKKYGHRGLSGYANAVLRGLLRSRPPFPTEGAAAAGVVPELYKEVNQYLQAKPLSADRFMIDDYWRSINQIRLLTVRLRPHIRSEEEILQSLSDEGVKCFPCLWPDLTYEIELGHQNLTELSSWRNGDIIVQGRAAQLPSVIAAAHQPKRVLDLCAAPGGKSLHLYDLLTGKVDILATDLYRERVNKIEENKKRLGITGLRTDVRDATLVFNAAKESPYDLVMADVPCSSLGLIDRKAELRLSSGHCDKSLLLTQAAILDTAASALRPGGILIYSTCTFNPEENQEQIEAFLIRQDGQFKMKAFQALPLTLSENPFTKKQLEGTNAILNLYPHIHGTEGFFIAQLERIVL